MKKGLYERYVPDTLLYESKTGQLYRGHDSVLRRDILLYISPRTEGHAERIMHGPYVLQILDRGETADEAFVVLEYVPGLLLDRAVTSSKLSLKEALGMARQLVQILQEASRTRGRGLLFTKYNLWLTEAGEVKVVNSWSIKEDAMGREISDLFRLLHHLMFGEIDIELPTTQIIEEMALAYPGDPFIIRKSLRAIWRREEKKGAEEYERMLSQTLEDITSLYHYIKKNQAGVRPAIGEAEPAEPAQEEDEFASRSSRTRMKTGQKKTRNMPNFSVKRMTAIALVAIVCVTAFAVLQDDTPSSAKSVEAVSPQAKNETPKEENKVGIEVPDVEGLPLSEAGQKLNQAGLRYKYYLDSSFSKKGTVLKQNPAAGEKMSRIDVVELWVSE